jgi:hypothetical protein
VAFAGDRVGACIHPDAVRPARQAVHRTASAPATRCNGHDASLRRLASRFVSRDSARTGLQGADLGGAGWARTHDRRIMRRPLSVRTRADQRFVWRHGANGRHDRRQHYFAPRLIPRARDCRRTSCPRLPTPSDDGTISCTR